MPKEHADLRLTIELISEQHPEMMITQEDAMSIANIKSRTTLRKYLPIVNGRVPKVALAKYMCGQVK